MDLSNLEVRGIADPWKEGIARGWDVRDGATLEDNQVLDADVVIVGSGAGGAVSAEILSKAGLKVVIIEAARLKSTDAFDMDEGAAYRDLYQEGAARANKDGTITILQGRAVGGTTVVNWTSSFRTPRQTLDFWASEFGVDGMDRASMDPYFETMEQRLKVSKWAMPPNANNAVIKRGCDALGWSWSVIPRNVDGCWNLGYCGTGCPTNAKQSMLVTTLPSAMDSGATLVHSCEADVVLTKSGRAHAVVCHTLDARKQRRKVRVTVQAKTIIAAGGGINTPALFMRSGLPDPNSRVGKRTFLHPTTLVVGDMEDTVAPYYGAPQSLYSDEFVWRDGVDGNIGYKIEVMPLHPGLFAGLLGGFGRGAREQIEQLPQYAGAIALLRDGFHEESQGGEVLLTDNGDPLLDYTLNRHVLEGSRDAHLKLTEMLFAAGAKKVRPGHMDSPFHSSWSSARDAINSYDYAPGFVGVGSAHVMGGCAMGSDSRCVVDSDGQHKHVENLYVFDGSVFPTSLGVNPQLTIYGMTARNAGKLAEKLTAEKQAAAS